MYVTLTTAINIENVVKRWYDANMTVNKYTLLNTA